MTSAAATELIPLSTTADGSIRIAGSRVTLDTVIDAFLTGASPEEIAQDFPVLQLDDIYAVLTYYLRHCDDRAAVTGGGQAPRDRAPLRSGRPARQAPRSPRALAPMLRLLADENFNGRFSGRSSVRSLRSM
ncbi:MAG: DUF433 domain-containing protein [Acidobacteriota bacterium]|nr:DUF433 domain-containing protein [Acidobacteriota bacterium]